MKVSQKVLEQIKTEALRLGFCQIGVTSPKTPLHFTNYKNWIERGVYGDMHYLAKQDAIQKRSDPNLLLPGCQSIICLAFPYPTINRQNEFENGIGLISSYALSPDYHHQLAHLLDQIIWKIQELLGKPFNYRCCVDSSPILEKDLASTAGLGWFGKNTCLISPAFGSFFFLSEILSELEFDFQPVIVPDRCGKCTKCIDACPTHCILPDHTIIANRCISYLTIEHKGIIPTDLRSQIGQWVFGCDICQLVCPWNNKISKDISSTSVSKSERINSRVNLNDEIDLTEHGFREKYSKYPMMRPSRSRFLRNIAVAIGNQRSSSNIEIIYRTLKGEKDPLVRTHLYWTLGQINNDRATTHLWEFSRVETDSFALDEIHQALTKKPSS